MPCEGHRRPHPAPLSPALVHRDGDAFFYKPPLPAPCMETLMVGREDPLMKCGHPRKPGLATGGPGKGSQAVGPPPPTSGLRSRASGPDCPQVPGSASSLRQSRGGGQWRELPPVPGLSGGCLALLPPQHHHLPSQLKGGPLKGCYLRGNVHPPLAAWGPLPDTSSGAPTHPHRRAIVLQAGKEPPSPLASGHNRKCVWGPSLRTNSRPTETASGQRALAPAWE